MHIVLIQVNYDPKLCDRRSYLTGHREFTAFCRGLMQSPEDRISVINRAAFADRFEKDGISYYMVKDRNGPDLSWWQEPDEVFDILGSLAPDIVHFFGLNLPLHFRWMRRHLPDHTRLIGHHTGEEIWVELRLWMQQFGMRVVDGFVFAESRDTLPWIKAAVILSRQEIFYVSSISGSDRNNLRLLRRNYNTLLEAQSASRSQGP